MDGGYLLPKQEGTRLNLNELFQFMEECMDRLDELTIFLAILDGGSLAAASRRLRRSPPAVSRILAGLEGRMGIRLVERTTRRIAPTEAGRQLADQARRLLSDYDEMTSVETHAGHDGRPLRGNLRVTAPLVFGRRHITPVIASFLARHPGITAELILHDRSLDLLEERLDVALRIGHLEDSTLVARKIGQVRRLLVASPDYLRRCGHPRQLDELDQHDIVLSTGQSLLADWPFHSPGSGHTPRITPRFQVNDVEAMLVMLRAGHGIGSVLSYQVVDELASGQLQRLLSDFEAPLIPVQLVIPSAHLMPAKTRLFLDHATASLKELTVLRME